MIRKLKTIQCILLSGHQIRMRRTANRAFSQYLDLASIFYCIYRRIILNWCYLSLKERISIKSPRFVNQLQEIFLISKCESNPYRASLSYDCSFDGIYKRVNKIRFKLSLKIKANWHWQTWVNGFKWATHPIGAMINDLDEDKAHGTLYAKNSQFNKMNKHQRYHPIIEKQWMLKRAKIKRKKRALVETTLKKGFHSHTYTP